MIKKLIDAKFDAHHFTVVLGLYSILFLFFHFASEAVAYFILRDFEKAKVLKLILQFSFPSVVFFYLGFRDYRLNQLKWSKNYFIFIAINVLFVFVWKYV